MKNKLFSITFLISIVFGLNCNNNKTCKTILEIKNDQFYINGKPTYEGRYWQGYKVEGLLLNSRMVQGIFDDLNPGTCKYFKYPDSTEYSADRNTDEFVASMDEWCKYGLKAFTINMQGGSPIGYGNKGWYNSAYTENGSLRTTYMDRLDRIMQKSDDLGMVVILGYFYFGQDHNLNDEAAVIKAVDNVTDWILEKGYRNILVEINNECNIGYEHEILQPTRVHELINRVKAKEKNGYRLLVSTSYSGGYIPLPNVIETSDYILLHGNGVNKPEYIDTMLIKTRKMEGYTPKPIVFNEDDHYNFDRDTNNFVNAIKGYSSWGYFDFRRSGEPFKDGFQSVPVDWGINSNRKKAFFNKVREIAGKDITQ